MMRAPLSLCLLLTLPIVGCASGPHPVADVVEAPRPATVGPMPVPPSSAARNLTLPPRLADGSYATPNRALSDAATIWHVRSALNVAALACPRGQALATDYNQLLRIQRVPFAAAHTQLAAEHRGGGLDAAMTRVYNYFSQPPAQRDFCPIAASLLSEAVAVPPPEFAGFARVALSRLDAPFIAFYRAYDVYRADLALWRAGTAGPQIAYDGGQFLRDDRMIGGERPKILATR